MMRKRRLTRLHAHYAELWKHTGSAEADEPVKRMRLTSTSAVKVEANGISTTSMGPCVDGAHSADGVARHGKPSAPARERAWETTRASKRVLSKAPCKPGVEKADE